MKSAMVLFNLVLGGLSVWGMRQREPSSWVRIVFAALCVLNVIYFANALLSGH
jgi:hypothetical protein